jgi:hypothetical protein
MKFGIQGYGPFAGLPVISWGISEWSPALSQMEFRNKLKNAATGWNITEGKRYLVIKDDDESDRGNFEWMYTIISLCKNDGWIVVIETPSTYLPAYATQANAVVAIHTGVLGWLQYPARGFVLKKPVRVEMPEPEFSDKMTAMPKYLLVEESDVFDGIRFQSEARHLWSLQVIQYFPDAEV